MLSHCPGRCGGAHAAPARQPRPRYDTLAAAPPSLPSASGAGRGRRGARGRRACMHACMGEGAKEERERSPLENAPRGAVRPAEKGALGASGEDASAATPPPGCVRPTISVGGVSADDDDGHGHGHGAAHAHAPPGQGDCARACGAQAGGGAAFAPTWRTRWVRWGAAGLVPAGAATYSPPPLTRRICGGGGAQQVRARPHPPRCCYYCYCSTRKGGTCAPGAPRRRIFSRLRRRRMFLRVLAWRSIHPRDRAGVRRRPDYRRPAWPERRQCHGEKGADRRAPMKRARHRRHCTAPPPPPPHGHVRRTRARLGTGAEMAAPPARMRRQRRIPRGARPPART
eukprot:scaffold5850_cov363-Prasinococcus_capsulatus_cf.AAC.2